MITKRDWIFLAVANALSIAMALASARYHLGWGSATFAMAVELVLLWFYCSRHPEPFFLRAFAFGMAAGWVELINDTWLVRKDILVYYPGGPFVIDTPLYMPFTWALIFVTNCSVALWLAGKLKPISAALVMALISGLYIPGFEAIAAKADWWYYQHVPMLFGLAPWFVVLGEALLALPLSWFSTIMRRSSVWVAVGLGALEGLLIFVTTLIALKVTS
ncbi:MAG TPA: hypothetical protein VHM70_18020 [Polyangiaceae bacterium]|jgi:hypothetical protein|nr:hypothetical protein [Polyangiaceae bacterium]